MGLWEIVAAPTDPHAFSRYSAKRTISQFMNCFCLTGFCDILGRM